MRFSSDKQRRAMFASIFSGGKNHFSKRKLYHGTAGLRGFAISKEGLVPPAEKGESFGCGGEFSDPNCVYVTGDKEVAKTFANAMADKFGGKPYVFEYDDDPDLNDNYLLDIEGFRDSWRHKGKIPPEKLKESEFSFRNRKLGSWYPENFNPPDNFPDVIRNIVFDIMVSGEFKEVTGQDYYDPSDIKHITIMNGIVNQRLQDTWNPDWGVKPTGQYIKPDVKDALEYLM